MPGIPMVTKTGPGSFQPVEFITGGQLVEARASGKVGVAAAGSLKVLGVALTDAMDPDTVNLSPTLVGGRPVLMTALAERVASVAYGGIEVPVTYAADAAFGDKLVAASSGRVTPAQAGADPRSIVGTCTQRGGVTTSASDIGLMRTV
jgi:hypothetical protein